MGKPSVEARVVEACADYWTEKQPQGALALKRVRIPEAGVAELLLLGPKQGTLIVVARSWPHAAAFAHVVGQAIGEVAHLMSCGSASARALVEGTEHAHDPSRARRIGMRLIEDAKAGQLGVVFAIGFTDQDGDEPVRQRLIPVLALLHRWAALGVPGLKLGVHLWSVRLDGDAARVELVQLQGTPSSPVSRPPKTP